MPIPAPNDVRGRDRRVALAIFFVVLGAYAYFFNGGGWNQNSHFDLTRSIVERHTFAIDAYADNTGDVSTTGGHVYSNKPPGLSLLAVAPYAALVAVEHVAGVRTSAIAALTCNAWLCTVAVCGLLGALIPVVLYLHGRRAFGLAPGWAAAIALVAALGTPLLPYSTMLYLHVPSAALLLVAFVASGRNDRWAPAVAGGAISAAAVLNYLCLPVVPLLVARSVRGSGDRRRAALLGVASALAPLAALAAYQRIAFGSIVRTSYYYGSSSLFVWPERLFGTLGAPSAEALWGITLSPHRGLFYASPVLLLALGGAVCAWRSRRRLGELALVCAIVSVFVGFNVCFNQWPGGWSFGPRYVIPIVPLLAIVMMHLAGSMRALWAALGAASVAISLMAAAVNPQIPWPVASPVRDYLLALLVNGRLDPGPGDGPWSAMDGHVSVNRQTVDEDQPFAKYPPGSAPQEWASFNLGEFVFGAGTIASLLPVLVWLAGGAFVLAGMAAGRDALRNRLRARPGPEPDASRERDTAPARWWGRLPRPVLVAVVAAWVVRAVLLGYCAPVSDEHFALSAASAPTVAQFFTTTDWAERWRIVRDLTTGDRPLWAASYLAWGSVLPSSGGAAYALSLAAALVAALALAGAARRLFGREEAGFVLVLASLSPLLLYYSASVMAIALCTMWVCLALFFLSSPRWRAAEWAAGGLCLGLAFGTHMAAGAPAIGLALALGISAAGAARDRGLPARERVRRSVALPLAGAAAAVAPLALIAAWARSAGDSYFGRLAHHENFGFADLGPRGLWLRQLLELDPMIEVALVVVACALIFGKTRPHGLRVAGGVAAVVVSGVLAVSLRAAPWRAPASLAVFAALGIGAWLTGAFSPATGSGGDEGPRDRPGAPLTPRTLALGAALIALLFTAWHPVSAMPRLVFPAWPLFVLVLVACARAALAAPPRCWMAPVAGLGCVLFALAAYSMVRLRSIPARADAVAAAHPGWQRLRFEDLWQFNDRMRAGGWLATRAGFDIEVVGGAPDLYPICTYEEEPYKIAFMAETLRDFGLEGVLTAHQVPWAQILFNPGPTDRPTAAGPAPGR